MNRLRVVAVGLTLCAAATISIACDSPTNPTDQRLRLVGQISQNVIPPTGTGTLTFQLENISSEAVALEFTSGCQIRPFIATRPSNGIVYPQGGGWVCTMMMSQLVLPPGGKTTLQVTVQSANPLSLPAPGSVGLAAGEYAAYARVEATGIEIQSGNVPFTVQ